MDDNLAKELEMEIKGYYDRGAYQECLQCLERHEKEANDFEYRAIVLIAKSNCAMHLGDWVMAENAINAIDITPLQLEIKNCVYLSRAAVAHHLGQLEKAESLFLSILASDETKEEPPSRIVYEAAARLGMLYSHQNKFRTSMDLLQKAEFMIPDGDFRDDIGIYQGYCLQGLGRLDEAEQTVRNVLENGSGDLKSSAYYRLGAIQLQKGDCDAAIESLQSALDSLPHGRIAESDIMAALEEAKDELRHNPIDRPRSRSRNKPRVQ